MGLRELLILLLGFALVAVVLRGLYLAVRARRGQIKMALEKNIPDYDPEAEVERLIRAELPNGGARVVERSFAHVVQQNSQITAREKAGQKAGSRTSSGPDSKASRKAERKTGQQSELARQNATQRRLEREALAEEGLEQERVKQERQQELEQEELRERRRQQAKLEEEQLEEQRLEQQALEDQEERLRNLRDQEQSEMRRQQQQDEERMAASEAARGADPLDDPLDLEPGVALPDSEQSEAEQPEAGPAKSPRKLIVDDELLDYDMTDSAHDEDPLADPLDESAYGEAAVDDERPGRGHYARVSGSSLDREDDDRDTADGQGQAPQQSKEDKPSLLRRWFGRPSPEELPPSEAGFEPASRVASAAALEEKYARYERPSRAQREERAKQEQQERHERPDPELGFDPEVGFSALDDDPFMMEPEPRFTETRGGAADARQEELKLDEATDARTTSDRVWSGEPSSVQEASGQPTAAQAHRVSEPGVDIPPDNRSVQRQKPAGPEAARLHVDESVEEPVRRRKRSLRDLARAAKRRSAGRKTEEQAAEEARAAEGRRRGPVTPNEVVVINVTARPDRLFCGDELVPVLVSAGLEYGDMNIFHRHVDGDPNQPVIFSAANILNPGTFDLNDIDSIATRGVCFFLTLPSPINNMQAFELMLEAARRVRTGLDGELKDDNRSVLTGQTIEHYRQRIRDFELRRLKAASR